MHFIHGANLVKNVSLFSILGSLMVMFRRFNPHVDYSSYLIGQGCISCNYCRSVSILAPLPNATCNPRFQSYWRKLLVLTGQAHIEGENPNCTPKPLLISLS